MLNHLTTENSNYNEIFENSYKELNNIIDNWYKG
jgi:hypothetical protein